MEQKMQTETSWGTATDNARQILSCNVGVGGSDVATMPWDEQNYFENQQILYLQFLTYDLVVFNAKFELESFYIGICIFI